MSRKWIGVVAAGLLMLPGCKFQMDSNDLFSGGSSSSSSNSNGSGVSGLKKAVGADSWEDTRAAKWAKKSRPDNHPDGKPWVALWVDNYPSNEAKPLDFECKPENENEICNGLDDDCDGKIDEECGRKSGPLQIAMAWEHHAQIDMKVTYAPWDKASQGHESGEATTFFEQYKDDEKAEFFFGGGRDGATFRIENNARGTCSCDMRYNNGELINCGRGCSEIRGACWADDRNEYVENAYVLDADTAPPGVYHINFYNRGDCPRRLKQVRVTVGIVVNGELVGHYLSGDLGPQGFSFPILTLFVPDK